jgi:hypothetical protein
VVILPQLLGRPAFIEQAKRLAHKVGADFHEVVLFDSKENALRRFAERSRLAADPAHVEAQEMMDRSGGIGELSAMYDRLVSLMPLAPRRKSYLLNMARWNRPVGASWTASPDQLVRPRSHGHRFHGTGLPPSGREAVPRPPSLAR